MNGKRTLRLGALARVEGEGRFSVKIQGNQVLEAKFSIFEPPRFFEAFLRGREYSEAPDFTSRICGICPIAYQMTAVHAMEDAFGIRVNGPLRELRRLVYCGEWIESHALHIHLLQGPDFLGYPDAFQMARDYPEPVKRGLELKKIGNEIITLIGGRAIHPVNVCVGGFFGLPKVPDFAALRERLKWGVEAALETVRWVARLPFPDFEGDYEFLSLRHHNGEYPMNEGRLVSSRRLDISPAQYDGFFVESQVAHSTALQTWSQEGRSCLLGPLARLSLNFDRLSPLCREALVEVERVSGFKPGSRNPFHGIIARAIEVLYAFDEALRILSPYHPPTAPAVEVVPRAGMGYSCTEAPRGTLYHRYEINQEGNIVSAKIVPPTSQNQLRMESDLRAWVERRLRVAPDSSDESLTLGCEKILRNYDPCISCATHFLKLKVERV